MVKESTNMVLLFVPLDCQLLCVYVYVSNRTVLVCIFEAEILVTTQLLILYATDIVVALIFSQIPFNIPCGPSIPQRSTLWD